jgi:hypothetical protein
VNLLPISGIANPGKQVNMPIEDVQRRVKAK